VRRHVSWWACPRPETGGISLGCHCAHFMTTQVRVRQAERRCGTAFLQWTYDENLYQSRAVAVPAPTARNTAVSTEAHSLHFSFSFSPLSLTESPLFLFSVKPCKKLRLQCQYTYIHTRPDIVLCEPPHWYLVQPKTKA
jgi:hypothetical protein